MTPITKPTRRLTVGALPMGYGPDSGRRLVVSLEPGDLISIRPAGTRRPETVHAVDLYRWALHCRVNAERLARAREKLAAKRIADKDRAIRRAARAALREEPA